MSARIALWTWVLALTACANAAPIALPVVNPRVHEVNLFELPVTQASDLAQQGSDTSVARREDAAPESHQPPAGQLGDPSPVVDAGPARPALKTLPEITLSTRAHALPPAPADKDGAAATSTDVQPVPTAYVYQLLGGETLAQAIARWARHDEYVLDYRATFQIPIPRDVTLPALTFREAVTAALTPLWGGRFALIAEETPQRTLIVRTP